MSTSGVDLSSLLQAMYGAQSSGIDVTSAVNSAVAAARAPEQQWQSQQQTLQNQTTALNQLQSQVTSLSDDLSTLSDPLGLMTSLATTSSQPSIVTATAGSGAAAGNHVVEVNNLATTASWYSDPVVSASTALATGSFQIQVGSGQATTITVDSTDNTLSGLASAINQQNLGVTASVVSDSTGFRLAIVSNASGAANDIAITNDTTDSNFLQLHQAAPGKDASLSVDGIPISSASNTVTGVVSGLTLNLAGASPGTEVDISAAPNTEQISAAVTSFVNDYNTVVSSLNSQFTYDSTSGNSGPLAEDFTVQSLQSQLLSAISYSGNSGSVTLGSLGISMNNDGTLAVDSGTLNNALQNNFSAVQNFFQGTAQNGFASQLNDQLQSFTDPADGAFTLDLQSISSENTDLQNQISNFETYTITPLQQTLTNDYNQAEQLLMSMPSQQQEINAELGYTGSNSQ
jgi:flagellar hook-associated protein 2